MIFGYWLQEYKGDDEHVLALQTMMNEDDFWPYLAEHIGEHIDYMTAQHYCEHHWDEVMTNVRVAHFEYCMDMTGRAEFDEVETFVQSSGPTKYILLNHDERLRDLQDMIYQDETWPTNALTYRELRTHVTENYCENHTPVVLNDLSLATLLRYGKET